MERKIPRMFVVAGLLWLCGGTTMGLAMAIMPHWVIYRPAHVHMNLVGFVSMIIFGVGYQILPRMMGYGLFSPRLALVHWGLANAGLALMVTGFFLRPAHTAGTGILVAGGILQAAGAYAFAYNLLRSMKRPRELRSAAPATRPLPVMATDET
jgi:cbb3-type cytochrome oxidase subunit 1